MRTLTFVIIWTITSVSCIGQIGVDSLVRLTAMYRHSPYYFVTHAQLESNEIQKELKKALMYIIGPQEIIKMAYDPSVSKQDFQEFIAKGCDKFIDVLEYNISEYKKVGKEQLDTSTYNKNKQAAKDSFEVALNAEDPEWYEFYVIQKGVTADWNKDRKMLTDIMNSKPYQTYMYALTDARRVYEAPYFKLHQDLVEVKSNILLYRTTAIRLYNTYHKTRIP